MNEFSIYIVHVQFSLKRKGSKILYSSWKIWTMVCNTEYENFNIVFIRERMSLNKIFAHICIKNCDKNNFYSIKKLRFHDNLMWFW